MSSFFGKTKNKNLPIHIHISGISTSVFIFGVEKIHLRKQNNAENSFRVNNSLIIEFIPVYIQKGWYFSSHWFINCVNLYSLWGSFSSIQSIRLCFPSKWSEWSWYDAHAYTVITSNNTGLYTCPCYTPQHRNTKKNCEKRQ